MLLPFAISDIRVTKANIINPTAAPIINPFERCNIDAVNPPAAEPIARQIFDNGTATDALKSLKVKANAHKSIDKKAAAAPTPMPIEICISIGLLEIKSDFLIINRLPKNAVIQHIRKAEKLLLARFLVNGKILCNSRTRYLKL